MCDHVRGHTDANRNGIVAIGKLARFVQAKTKTTSKGKEVPVVQVPGGMVRLSLARR